MSWICSCGAASFHVQHAGTDSRILANIIPRSKQPMKQVTYSDKHISTLTHAHRLPEGDSPDRSSQACAMFSNFTGKAKEVKDQKRGVF